MNILVWLGNKDMHPAIFPNMQSLATALATMGHQVITCNTAEFSEVQAAVLLLQAKGEIDLSIGANAVGMKVQLNDNKPIDLYKDADIIHISILLDEPFNPYCNGYEHPAKRHLITCLDRGDREYYARMQIAAEKYKLFMPLGGTSGNLSLDELLERKKQSSYEVVVSAGKFANSDKRPVWGTSHAQMNTVLDDILSLLQSEPLSVMAAAKRVLRERGMEEDYYFRPVARYFPVLLSYIKDWRRCKMLKELLSAGIEVDIFGKGWNEEDLAGKAHIRGTVSYAEMLQIIMQAKIVVNDEACFNDGAHDRVFTAMLNGAVVVSEYSNYLAEEFEAGEDLFLFDWQNTSRQMEIIPRLLSDDTFRETVACRAYAKTINKHTWGHRAHQLLEAAALLESQR